jgi:long-chain acyl-CoA synthetase
MADPTMAMGFWQLAQREPDRLALVDPNGKRLSAGELLAASNRLVHGLRALGLKPGDTVVTVLANEAAMVEIALATAQAGLYLTPINYHLTTPEIAYIVGDCEAKVVIWGAQADEVTRAAVAEVGIPESACFSTAPDAGGVRRYEELKAGQPAEPPAERRAGLVMNYTSGTTGRPKGVRRQLPPIDPDTAATRYAMFLMLFGIPPNQGKHLVVSPLYHTAVLSFCMNHLHNGDAVVLMDKWTPDGMLAVVEREHVTSSHMVPTHFSRLLGLPDEVKRRHDLSSLRHVIHSAAPCPVEVKRKMLDWWGPIVYEYYAASEGGGTLATPVEWLKHPGTVGNAWPMSEIRILDDNGQPLGPKQVGTVYMRMGDYRFEYKGDQKKTQDAWRDGLFTVGDAGYLDEDGFLFLCDRKSDMIISGGVNIYPAETEAVLIGHPKVRDVAVFGIPDDDWGEQVKAVIELEPGVTASGALVEELQAFCRERLAKHKCPRTIDFTNAMPRDPSGKLYKRKLRDPYWQGRERQI